ncbi:MAG: TRAP transporter small permease [Gammaproteobacteria bacterium]
MKHVEDALLVILLLALVVFAGAQIGARNLFDAGWIWGEQLVRVGVLWVGLLGAVVASRDDRHLRIDVVPRLLPPRGQVACAVIAHGVSAGVCAVIAWHAGEFVLAEREYGAAGIGAVSGWVLQAVMPVAFALMAMRHAAHVLRATARW